MRLDYRPFRSPAGAEVLRPCVTIRFPEDLNAVEYDGLLDTGSVHTIVPKTALGFDPGDPIDTVHLKFGAMEDKAAPVFRMPMEIVSPSKTWANIDLPDVAVALTYHKLEHFILGRAVLQYVVVVTREYDMVIHVKPLDMFQASKHHSAKDF